MTNLVDCNNPVEQSRCNCTVETDLFLFFTSHTIAQQLIFCKDKDNQHIKQNALYKISAHQRVLALVCRTAGRADDTSASEEPDCWLW